jgi:hypothetical protein
MESCRNRRHACWHDMHLGTHTPNSRIVLEGVLLDEAQNALGMDYRLADNIDLGRQVILRKAPPTEATHGLVGNVFRLRDLALLEDDGRQLALLPEVLPPELPQARHSHSSAEQADTSRASEEGIALPGDRGARMSPWGESRKRVSLINGF